MYCEYCGRFISDNINYCPYCGAKVNPVSSGSLTSLSSLKRYSLILVSEGSCSKEVTGDLLEDIFGYTPSQADGLVSQMPVMVAQDLTEEEAVYTAQVFSEYGIEISVHDEEDKYADLSSKAVTTVFNEDGSLLAKAAAVIGALTLANRVTSYKRYSKPSLLERIFRPLFKPKPVKHYRRFRPKQHRPEPKIIKEPKPARKEPLFSKPQPYRNTSERKQKPVTGHGGGPGGRMKGFQIPKNDSTKKGDSFRKTETARKAEPDRKIDLNRKPDADRRSEPGRKTGPRKW